MSWVATSIGLGVGGAGLNYLDAKNKQKQESDALMANAAQIQYSPWTHMSANVKGASSGSPLLAGIKGGLQGGMTGLLMASGNPAAAAGGAAQAAPLGGTSQQSPLGGQAMGAQLGQMGSAFDQPQFATLKKPNFYGG